MCFLALQVWLTCGAIFFGRSVVSTCGLGSLFTRCQQLCITIGSSAWHSALVQLALPRVFKDCVAGSALEHKRVAVIFRGETFRYGYKLGRSVRRASCAEQAREIQTNCTRSVIERIVEPLERQGGNVTIFFGHLLAQRTRLPTLVNLKDGANYSSGLTDTDLVTDEDMFKHERNSSSQLSNCPMDDALIGALHGNVGRTVKTGNFSTGGQADTVLKTLDSFEGLHGGVDGVESAFDLIMLIRNDVYWFTPIDQIQTDFNNINALSRCAPGMPKNVGGASCVHDTVWFVPGPLYHVFRSVLGLYGCFCPGQDPRGYGHACPSRILQALAKEGHAGKFGYLENDQRRIRSDEFGDITNNTGGHVADLVAQIIQ